MKYLAILDCAITALNCISNFSPPHLPGPYRHSSQQSLRHVSHDDTDQEDYCIQPVVAQDEGDDEESHSKEYSHASDDVDEMFDLTGNWGLTHLQTGGQVSDTAHHSSVTSVHHQTTACS